VVEDDAKDHHEGKELKSKSSIAPFSSAHREQCDDDCAADELDRPRWPEETGIA
jgi:hypothetical protein